VTTSDRPALADFELSGRDDQSIGLHCPACLAAERAAAIDLPSGSALAEAIDAARIHLDDMHPVVDVDVDGDRDELRISRDATPDDITAFTPGMGDAERSAWLDEMRATGVEVTFAVVATRPAGDGTAGLIVGPPGSRDFLRRPAELPEVLALEQARRLIAEGPEALAGHLRALENRADRDRARADAMNRELLTIAGAIRHTARYLPDPLADRDGTDRWQAVVVDQAVTLLAGQAYADGLAGRPGQAAR
jgi:hypothetical protein